MEVYRQSSMKQLAARADQRWREQESFLDKPEDTGQPQPLMEPKDKGAYDGGESKPGAPGANDSSFNAANTAEEVRQKTRGAKSEQAQHDPGRSKPRTKEDPWQKHARGPSESWQPEAWTPGRIEQR